MMSMHTARRVPMAAACLALYDAGLLTAVENFIANMSGPTGERARIVWERGNSINREHPLIVIVKAGLGLTDAQIDALFEAADEIAASGM